MMQTRSFLAGEAGQGPAHDRCRHDRIQAAMARARVTIPWHDVAGAEKQEQRQIERAERAYRRARPGDGTLDTDPRLTLHVVDRIIWLAHWMDRVSLNRLPPQCKRMRAEIIDLCRDEHAADLIDLAWARLAPRRAPVLERVAQ
jgi:hypothetical protein